MRTTALIGALVATVASLSPALAVRGGAAGETGQVSRTVVHKDDTYTTTRRDSNSATLIRETKRKNGTIVMRSEFVLDEFGNERKGRVFDGQGNLLFISEFVYERSELIEERVFNARGQIVRRLLYKLRKAGVDGRSMKPTVVTYQNGRPASDLMPMDDPGVFSTTGTHAHRSGIDPGRMMRSSDGSSVRLSADAVRYPSAASRTSSGSGSSSYRKPEPKPKRRGLRIFRRNR